MTVKAIGSDGYVTRTYPEPVTHVYAWRDVAGWSQDEMAKACDLDRVTVWRVERGVKVGHQSAMKIHNVTRIPVGDILSMEKRASWTVYLPPSSSTALVSDSASGAEHLA